MQPIIIQETDADILEVITLALQMQNFSVHGVQHPDNNFFWLIDQLQPGLVILDYRLDGNSSINTCRQIKAKYPNLPVIALSCNCNINELYAQNGFDGYVPKPFDLDTLFGIIEKYMPAD